ncbi:MAG: V-type ATP synthase subunit D [Elusimicrobiota bacterium]|nr:V-type ATP synthase subunit D [Endomicrobiia bacterium]MDW8165852.1 V-type ATP synthase subunit D [Elusimicrobiota bacterium]
MKIKINANRMNLLKLRKRLKFAVRGHKLLKDKQEQLTKEFNNSIFHLLNLRTKIETQLEEIYKHIKIVLSYKTSSEVENFFDIVFNNYKFTFEERMLNKYNIKFKEYKLQQINSFEILFSDPHFNYIVKKLSEIYEVILEMSNLEVLCEEMAKALQTTRRRVNALEYILIPQIKEKIRFIVNKLNELERTNITQLMRIKQLM